LVALGFSPKRVLRSTRGSATVLVGLVILIVSVVGLGLYTRLHQVIGDVQHQQNLVAARLLVDSAFELVQDQAARGTLKTQDTLEMASGLLGYVAGAEQLDTDNRRCRDAVAYGLCGKTHRIVSFRLVLDAPNVVGGPPVVGHTMVEMPTDVSAADLGPLPPQDPNVVLARAKVAMQNALP
jgi:hypothetical protein